MPLYQPKMVRLSNTMFSGELSPEMALPAQLLESEMFGHKKGSFTGADRDKAGLLEVAHNGTLFLDELTEMPIALQAKLLRVIQDGVVRRVGSEQEDATVDVRFISATNRDPEEAIRTHVLRDLAARKNLEFRQAMIGKTVSAVTLDNGALSENYLKIKLASNRPASELIDVKIAGVTADGLYESGALPILS